MDKLKELDEMGFRVNPFEKLIMFTKFRTVNRLSYRQALVINSLDYLPEYKILHLSTGDFRAITRRMRGMLIRNMKIKEDHFLIKRIPTFPSPFVAEGDMKVNCFTC